MQFEMNLVFCVLVVVLTGSSQTRGHGSALLPVTTLTAIPSLAVSSASPHLTEDAGTDDLQWTHNPTARGETTTMNTTVVHSETATKAIFTSSSSTASSAVATSQHSNVPFLITAPATPSPSAAADSLSSSSPTAQSSPPPPHIDTTTEARGALLTTDPPATSSSQLAHSLQDTTTTATATASSIQPQSESLTPAATTQQPTTARLPLTSTAGRGPVGPTHKEVPSELNVGDEDIKRPRSRSPLDPLLAGLLSVFIVTTAFVFVVLFLKFRQRTNHPEFHRLQDLPMDDLMEDTPLSRYSY